MSTETNLEPIGPQEAAEKLYREPIGQPSPERPASYEPIPIAGEKKPDEESTFSADRSGLEQAAQQIVERRVPDKAELQAKSPPIIQMERIDTRERFPDGFAMTVEQGADAVNAIRSANEQAERTAIDAMTRAEVDAARGQQTTQGVGAEVPPPEQTAQPEQIPQSAEAKIQQALSDPDILAAV